MKLNVIRKTKASLILALAVILAGIVMTFVGGGLNLGIDFTGGSLVTLSFEQEYNTQDITDVLNAANAGETSIVKSENNQAIVRLQLKPEEELSAINEQLITGLKEKGYAKVSLAGVDRVGATTSKELVWNAFISVAIACALILIYVWARFELHSGISAILALIHDVAIMISFVAIFRIPINSSFIAAILTIVGYSINSTILVFDRLRENKKLYTSMSDADLINKSIDDTFWRSVNTSLTTFITVFILYIFGVESIKEFTLPIMVGLIAGAFSSIMLAGQWWYLMKRTTKKA